MSRVFETEAAVRAFMADEIDRPLATATRDVSPGVTLTSASVELGDGRFTNCYTLQIEPGSFNADVRVSPRPQGVNQMVDQHDIVATSAGFFYLADRDNQKPRQSAMNLAVGRREIYSLPVRDREAVLLHGDNTIEAQVVKAVGSVSIGKHELSWSGSLTDEAADVRVYGNGNAQILHDETGKGLLRVLQEESHFTPELHRSGLADVGCARDDQSGEFTITTVERDGGLNIFDHDLVLRVPRAVAKPGALVAVTSLDGREFSNIRGGFTAGPLLETPSFGDHEINDDYSLGSFPPFTNRRMARLALFGTADGMVNFQLFDARPGSPTFTGVTPREAVTAIHEQFGQPKWGVFLDPGQTARIVIRDGTGLRTFGNRHYLDKMPGAEPGPYTWTPDDGRPVSTAIVLR